MSAYEQAAGQSGGPWQGRRCGGGAFAWKPVEIVAVVVGFSVYWPIGVAVLGWKFLQRKGYPVPDVFEFARARFTDFASRATAQRQAWQPFGAPKSGNAAFDEWRKAELAKLDEQRRKLDAAEREFAEHTDNLRRARDREEFDRFMAARGSNAQ